jgi:hypothetical protein
MATLLQRAVLVLVKNPRPGADILRRSMARAVRKKTNLRKYREVVSILMESVLYFDLPLKERLVLVQRLVVRMEQEAGAKNQK